MEANKAKLIENLEDKRAELAWMYRRVYVSTKTACKILDCSKNTLLRQVAAHGIKRYNLGDGVRFDVDDIHRLPKPEGG